MGKNSNLPLLENVTVTAIGAEGNAIAKTGGMAVFVKSLVPGDVVDIQITKKRRSYMEGKAVAFHTYSPSRQKPACRHFGTCGGCSWQNLPYTMQLEWKQKQVTDSLERIGHLEIPEPHPIIGSPETYHYRNKLEYTFSDRRWLTDEEIKHQGAIAPQPALGFHIPGKFDKVLDIEECLLQPEPSNSIRNATRQYATENRLPFFNLKNNTGLLRNIIIRNTLGGSVMVTAIFSEHNSPAIEGLLDFLSATFPQITSLYYVINPKRNSSLTDLEPVLYRGAGHLTEHIDNMQFRIGPKTFCQTNTRQGAELYRKVRQFAALSGAETVYDLYTGAGTIANYVASGAAKVIGIEYVEEAVADARANAEINGISNTSFFAGDMKDVLSISFFETHGSPDIVITDPPRAGMHHDVIKAIRLANPSKIIYVSCNPATQARDLQLLHDMYSVSAVQPVDMFPHTLHVENIVLLERRFL
jgi:23S rRNA (uracil1939-C5)-methyltransferase